MTEPTAEPGRIKPGVDATWESLKEGDRLVSTGITITEAHLVTWAGLTGDIVQFHLDASFAASTPFGERIAHGPLTLSLALGLITQTGYMREVIAWLGLDEVRASRPVLLGDSIRAEATVLEARPTSKQGNGVWTLGYRVLNHRDEAVMTFRSSFLVRRSG